LPVEIAAAADALVRPEIHAAMLKHDGRRWEPFWLGV
jgi:hypothetical protein